MYDSPFIMHVYQWLVAHWKIQSKIKAGYVEVDYRARLQAKSVYLLTLIKWFGEYQPQGEIQRFVYWRLMKWLGHEKGLVDKEIDLGVVVSGVLPNE